MKRKINNLREFKALIERYETITIEEVRDVMDNMSSDDSAASVLTGFGATATCTLCQHIRPDFGDPLKCYTKGCVYAHTFKEDDSYACISGELADSYDMISDAEDPQALFLAYRNRAVVMREFAKRHNIKL